MSLPNSKKHLVKFWTPALRERLRNMKNKSCIVIDIEQVQQMKVDESR